MRSLIVLVLATPALARADAGVSGGSIQVSLAFDGQAGTSPSAPDVGGASGGKLVEAVGGFVTIRDEGGHVVSTTAADAFWTAAGIAGTPRAAAQRAAFNANTQRWYVSAEQLTAGAPNEIYLAISASSDPAGPWKAVALPALSSTITNTHLAVDPCGAYLTGDTASGGVVMALPYVDLQWTGGLSPSTQHLSVSTTALAGVVPAIDASNQIGSDSRFFLGRDVTASGHTAIDVYRLAWDTSTCGTSLHAQLGAPTMLDFGFAYAPPSRPAVQPAPGPGLAAGNGAIANADASNGVLVGIAPAQVGTQIGALWFQIYADPSTPTAAPSLAQGGALVESSADLLAPAIAVSPRADGSFGIVYVRTSATEAPAIFVTGQGNSDLNGTLRQPTLARHGDATYSCMATNGVSAFGRYSSIAGTATGFWAFAQFGASATDCAFGTAWVNFDVISYGGYDFGDVGDDSYPVDHPPKQPPPLFGCIGCASSGDASSLLVLAAIVTACAGRRSRRRRP